MTEVDDFAQSDLDEEDVMLLDTWEEVRGSKVLSHTEIQCQLRPKNWELDSKSSEINKKMEDSFSF